MSSYCVDSLSVLDSNERDEYIGLIKSFAEAKLCRDYEKSDKVRDSLRKWQSSNSDDEWINMAATGNFSFCSIFETSGKEGNRHRRALNRKQRGQ